MTTTNVEAVLRWAGEGDPPEELKAAWDELAALKAALSRARAEALEEAAHRFEEDAGWTLTDTGKYDRAAALCRSLITTPAIATIPMERVREVLADILDKAHADVARHDVVAHGAVWCAIEAAKRLGVPLDAAQAHDEPAHDPSPHLCKGCDKPADGSEGHRFSCTVYGKRQVVLSVKVSP